MYGIEKEAAIFFCACLSGGIVVFAYEIIKVFRRLIRHSDIAVNIEDFFYWIFMSVYLFDQMYCTTYGVIRWYFVLGVVLGVLAARCAMLYAIKLFGKCKKILEKSGKTK
ncbi:MAG: hypothetical protein HFH53_06800 [Hespellia sp.]|jgi:hypothetical protein|nr:hypothetical protein [Hespellia sp.]